jgi:hypothetical protein
VHGFDLNPTPEVTFGAMRTVFQEAGIRHIIIVNLTGTGSIEARTNELLQQIRDKFAGLGPVLPFFFLIGHSLVRCFILLDMLILIVMNT